MIRYIIRNDEGLYQYPRKEVSYGTFRVEYGKDLNKARLFMNRSAAMNSLNYNNTVSYRYKKSPTPKGLKVVKVEFDINEISET